jgi:hypothetical protein
MKNASSKQDLRPTMNLAIEKCKQSVLVKNRKLDFFCFFFSSPPFVVGTILGDENYISSFNSSSIYNNKSLDLSNGWKPQTSVTFQEQWLPKT